MPTCSRCNGYGAIAKCSGYLLITKPECVNNRLLYKNQPVGVESFDCLKCKYFTICKCPNCNDLGLRRVELIGLID